MHLVFSYLRSLFGAAVSDRVIATSPCSGARLPKIDKRDYFIPGPEKVHALASLIAER
ncbi:hypothetical protein Ae707Ps1_4017 [Pseudonocardia sp. Ae707_Ps1]|nr:hypothetical protein Ae707Ps1_4017 [Pseudonocardia sp. Ae707_Ps1]